MRLEFQVELGSLERKEEKAREAKEPLGCALEKIQLKAALVTRALSLDCTVWSSCGVPSLFV